MAPWCCVNTSVKKPRKPEKTADHTSRVPRRLRTQAQEAMTAARQESPPVVYTVGHSTRPLGEFIELLQTHGVTHLLDVRTVPRSRHNPQFNTDSLPAALEIAGISYTHIPGLDRKSVV